MSDVNPTPDDVATPTSAASDLAVPAAPEPPPAPPAEMVSDTDSPPARRDSATAVLKLARQATARIVTAALEATAESADMERADLARRFPAMTSLPAPLRLDPQRIRDFARSADYQQLVEQYVAGRVEGHLLTRVLDLLTRALPVLFAR